LTGMNLPQMRRRDIGGSYESDPSKDTS
jgi:hypothetical protein